MTAPLNILVLRRFEQGRMQSERRVARRRAMREFILAHPGCTKRQIREVVPMSDSQFRVEIALTREIREVKHPGQDTRYYPERPRD